MDETKTMQDVYSRDRIQTTSIQAPAEAITPPESPRSETAAPRQPDFTGQIAAAAASLASTWPTSLPELAQVLKRTKRIWLALAASVAGVVALVMLTQRASAWIKDRRERRQDQAIATVTPDHLIARCGQAAQDETKEVYPIVMRTMSYQRGNEKFVVAFSRTAEEKSDWVFLSMQDSSGANTYDTPQAKIAALPCLDSRR